jgi:hypothetical protein
VWPAAHLGGGGGRSGLGEATASGGGDGDNVGGGDEERAGLGRRRRRGGDGEIRQPGGVEVVFGAVGGEGKQMDLETFPSPAYIVQPLVPVGSSNRD